ncbi:hypothetical protein PVK06_007250 [Gossypium arboreum]|uniref:Sorting nexin C-terminal domain-containing protein n=1 Tax=Gossypium arboreum TaxID=29729 RepID=A0ABR0QH42_GOSAR|nr:hypothetical protein PVK06_007250 [Gossypium arboreum]
MLTYEVVLLILLTIYEEFFEFKFDEKAKNGEGTKMKTWQEDLAVPRKIQSEDYGENLHKILWPGVTFFTKAGNIHGKFENTQPNQTPSQNFSQFGGGNINKPGSFEEQLEAARRASNIKKMLFDGAPTALVSLIGKKQYRRCARDIYFFTQSTICMKQLAYAILELVIISVFPELQDLMVDLHGKKHIKVA